MFLLRQQPRRNLGDVPGWFAGAGAFQMLLLTAVALWMASEHKRR
jgi:hypothetical protein